MPNFTYLDYFSTVSSKRENAKDYINQESLPEQVMQRQAYSFPLLYRTLPL